MSLSLSPPFFFVSITFFPSCGCGLYREEHAYCAFFIILLIITLMNELMNERAKPAKEASLSCCVCYITLRVIFRRILVSGKTNLIRHRSVHTYEAIIAWSSLSEDAMIDFIEHNISPASLVTGNKKTIKLSRTLSTQITDRELPPRCHLLSIWSLVRVHIS